MIQVVEKYYWILFALLMALIVFFSFWRLDAAYVNSWDEARHGVNAYEMKAPLQLLWSDVRL